MPGPPWLIVTSTARDQGWWSPVKTRSFRRPPRVLFAILLSLSWPSVASAIESGTPARIVIEELMDFGGSGEANDPAPVLSTLLRATIAIGGELIVADRDVHVVHRFAPDGAYLGTIARRGEGPGEFDQLQSVATGPNGTIFVMDRRTVSVFDGDTFEFVTTHTYQPSGALDLAVDESGGFVITSYDARSGTMVHAFDRRGTRIDSWIDSWAVDLDVTARHARAFSYALIDLVPDGGGYVYTQFHPRELVWLTPEGDESWRVSLAEVEFDVEPRYVVDGDRTTIGMHTVPEGTVILPDLGVLTGTSKYRLDSDVRDRTLLQLVSEADGSLVARTIVDQYLRPLAADDDGYVYFATWDPWPRVVKCSVRIDGSR